MTHPRFKAKVSRSSKSIHWFKERPEARLEQRRKAQLSAEERGVQSDVINLMWIDKDRIVDDMATVARRIGLDVRQIKRIVSSLVSKAIFRRADGYLWCPETLRDVRELCHSSAVAIEDLSEKPAKINETGTTELELALEPSTVSRKSGDDDDDVLRVADAIYELWPDRKAVANPGKVRELTRKATVGATGFEPVAPDELLEAAQRHAVARGPRFVGSLKDWLADGGWKRYAQRTIDRTSPDASNLDWFDDRPRLDAMHAHGLLVPRFLDACERSQGWPADAGDSPTSGTTTELHRKLAGIQGLIGRLEDKFGIEFPPTLHDDAETTATAPANLLACLPRADAFAGRAHA